MSKPLKKLIGKSPWGKPIPGSTPEELEKVRYVSIDLDKNPSDVFREVIFKVSPSLPEGGARLPRFLLTTPSVVSFFALKYHKDIIQWQTQIELGAKMMGLLSARIAQDRFIISDGSSFLLSECAVDRW